MIAHTTGMNHLKIESLQVGGLNEALPRVQVEFPVNSGQIPDRLGFIKALSVMLSLFFFLSSGATAPIGGCILQPSSGL